MQWAGHLEHFGVVGLAQGHEMWTRGGRLMDYSLTHLSHSSPYNVINTVALWILSTVNGLGFFQNKRQYRIARGKDKYTSSFTRVYKSVVNSQPWA